MLDVSPWPPLPPTTCTTLGRDRHVPDRDDFPPTREDVPRYVQCEDQRWGVQQSSRHHCEPFTQTLLVVDKRSIYKVASGDFECNLTTTFANGAAFESSSLKDGSIGLT
ncbi:hypothetical protein V7S43_013227 [Phytophthora oleae]|uniref:Uncharacterized protein n=1 Tax=Phytophthora oleae TaxID=2107226 RepID=A0ABD3F519_9STRA